MLHLQISHPPGFDFASGDGPRGRRGRRGRRSDAGGVAMNFLAKYSGKYVITYHQFPSHMIKYHHNVYYPSSFYHLRFLTKRAKKYHSCRGETRGPALVEINDCKSFENFEFCDVIHDIHGY